MLPEKKNSYKQIIGVSFLFTSVSVAWIICFKSLVFRFHILVQTVFNFIVTSLISIINTVILAVFKRTNTDTGLKLHQLTGNVNVTESGFSENTSGLVKNFGILVGMGVSTYLLV
jgi:hypothetical protein